MCRGWRFGGWIAWIFKGKGGGKVYVWWSDERRYGGNDLAAREVWEWFGNDTAGFVSLLFERFCNELQPR